jgi:copper chaperone CopZ
MAHNTIETIQTKVSGMMCSFRKMSIERALKRYPSGKSVLVNLIHGVVLVVADMSRIIWEELAATSSVPTEVSS